MPLPKNLIPPEYLIVNDPTYANISDKMYVEFLDCSKGVTDLKTAEKWYQILQNLENTSSEDILSLGKP